jgi:hypothetical protein
MDVRGLMKLARAEPGEKAASEAVTDDIPRFKWVVIESRLLDGEEVVLVMEKKYLKEAQAAHPDKVLYFPPEVRELYPNRDNREFIRTAHSAKKEFGGWVVPKDSPIARELNSRRR